MKNLSQVLVRPVVTEKSTELNTDANKYVFEVAVGANKKEVCRAVEQFFGVKVLDVRTMNMKGKPKRQGMFTGRRSNWKKAIVTLSPKDKIDMFDVV